MAKKVTDSFSVFLNKSNSWIHLTILMVEIAGPGVYCYFPSPFGLLGFIMCIKNIYATT